MGQSALASSSFLHYLKIKSREGSDCCMICPLNFARFNVTSTVRGALVNLTSFTSPINPVCKLQDVMQTRVSNSNSIPKMEFDSDN